MKRLFIEYPKIVSHNGKRVTVKSRAEEDLLLGNESAAEVESTQPDEALAENKPQKRRGRPKKVD